MANVWATKNGIWSDTTVWNTAALPTASDAVWASGSTVYIDQNITVQSLNAFASGTIGAGGTFATSASINIATSTIRAGTSQQCLQITGSGITVNITGSSVGGSANPSSGIGISSSLSTINISGSCTAGTAINSFGVAIYGTAPTNNIITLIGNCSGSTSNVTTAAGFGFGGTSNNLIITGSLVGGTGNATNVGLFINATNPYTASILGNITGSTGPGLYYNTSTTGIGTTTINGNVISSATGHGIQLPSGCTNATLRISGSVSAGAGGFTGLLIQGTSITASVNGNVAGGSGTSAIGISNSGTSCLVVVTGSVTGGSAAGGAANGAVLGGTQNNLIISGSVIGGTVTSANAGLTINATNPYTASIIGNVTVPGAGYGMYFSSPTGLGTVNITGSVFGGNGSGWTGINLNGTTNLTLNISGSVAGGLSGGSSAYGINFASTGTNCIITIRGDVTGSAGTSYGIFNQTGPGIIIISGSVISQGGIGVYNNLTGTILISGSAIAGAFVGAFNGVANGTLRVIGAVASTASAAINGVNIAGTTTFESATFGANGQVPWLNYAKLVSGSNNFISASVDTGGYKVLVDNNNIANGLPTASDVRLGTSYNFGSSTGTAAVPSSNQVAAGIAVDNTTGSAVLTAANVTSAVWDTQTTALTTSGSIGERFKNSATVSSTGDQIAALTI